MVDARDRSAVILDRHPLWLDAMDRLVTGVGMDVVGRTTVTEEASRLVDDLRPDAFIAGIDPGNSEQVACVREISEAHPDLKSVVVSDRAEPDAIEAAFAAGAVVYCVKTAQQEDLAAAIRQAFERSIFMATKSEEGPGVRLSGVESKASRHDLTKREVEILRLVAEGHSNSQLAGMLWVTEQTVKFHLSNIYRKLDVANRTEASRWAQVNGLLTPDPAKAAAVA